MKPIERIFGNGAHLRTPSWIVRHSWHRSSPKNDVSTFLFTRKCPSRKPFTSLILKIYNLKSTGSSEVIKLGNKFYLAEIRKVEKNNKLFNDPDVQGALNAQLNFKNKIESNTSILKDISMGAFNEEKFKEFALKNDLNIKDYKIKDLKQNEIFSEEIIKRIFLTDDNQIDLITNNTVTKNYLILVIKTDYKNLSPKSNEYEQYEAKARLNLINKIYLTHDSNLNSKYKVELNQRTIERVKNSF